MTDYKHLRELAEASVAAEPNAPWFDPESVIPVGGIEPYDAAYIAAADPQTMIALLDELEHVKRRNAFEALRELDDLVEAIEQRKELQARIDAALVQVGDTVLYVPDDEDVDPDWEAAYMEGVEHVKLHLRRILSAPTENGEEQ